MKYTIGVDGGGTKVEATAYSMEGTAIKTSIKGFGNLLNNQEKALKNIVNSIKEIIEFLPNEELISAYLGIAGSEVGNNSKIIKQAVKEKLNIDCVVMNDSEIALKAMLKGEDGILVIAGTGSVALGIKKNKTIKCGGWGSLLGDEGSGYKIAIEAIKRMILEEEYSMPKSRLSKNIMKKLNIESAHQITDFVYSSTKDEIASLAPIVVKLSEEGDDISIQILLNESIAFARTTENVYRKLGVESCNIALVGGVIRNSIIFRTAFENHLRENTNVKDIIDEEVSPTIGAYYMEWGMKE
ncbi:ATPase [Clostridium botulinum]|uniref:N-acetylglucosamine kinase n=1 Tax=Clostridium botulinum TaxID=1491 RepID=UPI0007746D04|nr:BadF/BadG/BcrA/BcrD ATPase family protein [Clostridium botulinum]NFL85729.1 ATPase [Clostridium botulinum]NFO20196.1 ATPase [Clostridium botulinum]